MVAEGRMTHASVEFDGVSRGQEELYFIGCALAVCVKAAEKGGWVGVGVQSFLHKALTGSRQPPGTLLHWDCPGRHTHIHTHTKATDGTLMQVADTDCMRQAESNHYIHTAT